MDRLYRINKKCPVCKEEHQYWTIKLTNEEQALLDKYTENTKMNPHQCRFCLIPEQISSEP